MAKIVTSDVAKVLQIQKFLGLNESKDGDTQLKVGEASRMENWQITPQHHLKVRPGMQAIETFQGAVRGLWHGFVAGEEITLCAADGGVWKISEGKTKLGNITDAPTTFFGFNNKVYMLNGHEYLSWDGTGSVQTVEGYIPLVVTAASPKGGGTTLENVNRLTGKKRVRFSADGESTKYVLPEGELLSIDQIYVDGALMQSAQVTKDTTGGTVTFSSAPQTGNNNVEIYYTAPNELRSQVTKMRYWEFFNGANDTRVFLYGDGTAKALYCGITEAGIASAEYFPDLYEMLVGDENTPITAMVKHYDRLLTFKPGSVYATEYSAATLADGVVTAGFYTIPLNREIGNEAPGQVRLVYNFPRSMYANALYDWKMTSSTVRDERNAKLVSEKVRSTLQSADPEKVFIFDDDSKQEYYVFLNDTAGTALVHRYIEDVWYKYTNLKVVCGCRDGNDVYFGTSDGKLVLFDELVHNDLGQEINCIWESGNMDFGSDYQRKHSSVIWVSLKPAAGARCTVSARSDRKSEYAEKTVTAPVLKFSSVDFKHFTFNTNTSPHMRRVKLKVKKFVYYKLLIDTVSIANDVTVLGVDMRVRFTGYVK
nr:MAG TPA: stabilization protein [Caudoviricetes sp.]